MTTSADRIDVNDDFNLVDIRETVYLNEEDAIKDLKRVFAVVDYTPEVYAIKDFDPFLDRPKVSYTNQAIAKQKLKKLKMLDKQVGKNIKSISAWDLYLDNISEFTVKALKFYSDDPQVLSYFKGYDIKQLDKVKEEIIQPFLDHIYKVIANENSEVYKYILVWIASILQKPDFKPETAIVILGNQGTGKNIFTNVICKLMARYAHENITNIESVVGKFNAVLENKKLIILNELQSIDTNKYLNSDALKSVITDHVIDINQKNEPQRKVENVCNFIMVSNNDFPIKVEDTDRRYLITKTSDIYRGDYKYFENLTNHFTSEFYENLFTFFMIMDIKEKNLRNIPETDARRNLKEASASTYELFVRERYREIVNITGPELFGMFCNFVDENRFKPCSSKTFITNIKKYTGSIK